jgi:hypothetical protein
MVPMQIVESTKQRLVVEDTSKKMAGAGFTILLLLACVFFIALGLWGDGLIPGTATYHQKEIEGHRGWWFTIGFGTGALFCLLIALLQSHSRIIFDKAQGYLTIIKVRLVGKVMAEQAALSSVRGVRVDSQGDVSRIEIELTSGEKILPRRTYNNYDQLDALQKVAESVNAFLTDSRISS